MKAECQCVQLSVELPETSLLVIACHCLDCQRRTGAPFGVLAYYWLEQIKIKGEAKSYERSSAEGNAVETFFCQTCGSTVYIKLEKKPALVGVSVGAIADPAFQAPTWSVWEQSKHRWLEMPGNMQHFERGD